MSALLCLTLSFLGIKISRLVLMPIPSLASFPLTQLPLASLFLTLLAASTQEEQQCKPLVDQKDLLQQQLDQCNQQALAIQLEMQKRLAEKRLAAG